MGDNQPGYDVPYEVSGKGRYTHLTVCNDTEVCTVSVMRRELSKVLHALQGSRKCRFTLSVALINEPAHVIETREG